MAVTIKAARTALAVLAEEDLSLEGAIAHGVLKLFVDQKEAESWTNNVH